jgi:hypothetical protein
LVVEAPNPPAPLSLLVTRLLVTDWWDCNVPSQCQSGRWSPRNTIIHLPSCKNYLRFMQTDSARNQEVLSNIQTIKLLAIVGAESI